MLKHNPFARAKRGDVLAIRIGRDEWGFIRYRHTAGFGVLPFYAHAPGMPDVRWHDEIEKWFEYDGSSPGRYDPDLYRRVGSVPFDHDGTTMPPRYQDPDPLFRKYSIIYSRPMRLVYVDSVEDIKGIQKSGPMLPPEQIADFIREKFQAGLLTRVTVLPAEGAGADEEREPVKWPNLVYARLVGAIHPAQRERIYEQPLAEFLAEHDLGEITGGGTMQDRDGSVLFAGIDIEVADIRHAVPLIAGKLAELGAPEGSALEYELDGEAAVYPIRRAGGGRGRTRGKKA